MSESVEREKVREKWFREVIEWYLFDGPEPLPDNHMVERMDAVSRLRERMYRERLSRA